MRTVIFIIIYSLSTILCGQNKIKVDKSLIPELIVCRDTSFWFDPTDTTYERLIPYPNNSTVAFDDKFREEGDTLPNCTIVIKNDTTFIDIFKLSYGLHVYLKFFIVEGTYKTTLIHSRVSVGVYRIFHVDKSELLLNQSDYTLGQILVGKINLTFSGTTMVMETGKEKKVKGNMTGLFKATIK